MKRFVCMLLAFTILGLGQASAEVLIYAYGEDIKVYAYGEDIKAVAAEQYDGVQRVVCEHGYLIYEQAEPYKEGYESCGSVNHAYFEYYRAACRLCSSEGTVVVMGLTQQHTWTYENKNEHVVGKSRHAYTYECNVCEAEMIEYYPCPGTGNGDCIIIMPGAKG